MLVDAAAQHRRNTRLRRKHAGETGPQGAQDGYRLYQGA
ncbi:hypothetical protein GLA29479_4336 [Lysobacter antibioticus]|uniref:Uncharacterized protein n=1 Tax=Lysobacter antibioticus TaxID=84531 RepID=A0A0S2E2Y8_LYSAN|nr:hypothetical protein GLA29479_4336 [Lysobacter antibioticus]ALN79653.1 hypothetical protein LA76x_1498 [Lysobacter antibioticus]